MKKIIIGAVVLLTAACGVSALTPDSQVTTPDAEEIFVGVMQDEYPGASDDDLLDLGYLVCDSLSSGTSIDELLLITESYEEGELMAFTIGASSVLCPENAGTVEDYLDAHGQR